MSFLLARASRAAVFLIAGTAITYAPACSHAHETPSNDAVYEGGATDEGLTNLEGLATTTDAARAPLVTSPTKDAKLPSASAPTFTWKATPTSSTVRDRDSLLGSASLVDRGERFALEPLAPTRAAPLPFGPMRSASAHGTPMNGRAFLLVFKGSGGANVLKVFTTNTTYQPNAESFTKLKDAKTLSLTVSTASFDNNNVVQGSGPFAGEAVSFSFDP